MRSDCLYSSSQASCSHFNPSKIESTEAWVLRSTSVSSSRRIMVPPLWRAYSQLKMNVRALPTCRKPVGEGAKRTRGLESDDVERTDSGMAEVRWYGAKKVSSSKPEKRFFVKSLILCLLGHGQCT